MRRWEPTPEKIEMCDGQLFWSDEDRLLMLGMLLENVGIDAAIKLGDPKSGGMRSEHYRGESV
jgi:hypothetical protein